MVHTQRAGDLAWVTRYSFPPIVPAATLLLMVVVLLVLPNGLLGRKE